MTKALLGEQAENTFNTEQDFQDCREDKNAILTMLEDLRRSEQKKNEFLNLLSHELRNPLASLKMSLSLLRRVPPDGEKALMARSAMERQTAQLARLVDDLLDITRLNCKKLELKKETLELNSLVQLCAGDYKMQFEEKGILLEVREAGEGIYLEGDQGRLTQVLGNLLHNALKFTGKGERTVLTVSRDQEGPDAIISVKDSGRGIRAERLPNLFQAFVQAGESRDGQQGGLGLGLAIVKGIVELHGGSIAVYSEGLGKGTEFTIRLPSLPGPGNTRESGPQMPEHPLRPLRILIIDDIPDIAEILCSLLNHLGYQAEAVNSGAEGIHRAKEFYPEVLLCDIGLPGMNGYEVAEHFGRDPVLKNTVRIALSGFAQQADVEQSKAAGFHRHIAKPVDLAVLQKILHEEVGQLNRQ